MALRKALFMQADWYPDPTNAAQQRYWDGTSWTEHVEIIATEVAPDTAVSLYEPLPEQPADPQQWPGAQQPYAAQPGAQQPYAAQPGYQPVVTPGYGAPVGGQVVSPKNPALSLIISFFIPGVGSIVNGDVSTGVIILLSSIFLNILIFVLSFILIGFLFIPFSIGLWIYGMVHAYQGAVRWNAAHGVVS